MALCACISEPLCSPMAIMMQVTAVVQPSPRDGKKRDYCFVHFADHSVVEQLIADSDRGSKPNLDGNSLEVRCCLSQWQSYSANLLKAF